MSVMSAVTLGMGWVIDGILALTVLEGLALWLYHRRSGRGLPVREFALALTSGLCLMLALRAIVGGAGTVWMLVALAAAGLTHVADLWWRWPRS